MFYLYTVLVIPLISCTLRLDFVLYSPYLSIPRGGGCFRAKKKKSKTNLGTCKDRGRKIKNRTSENILGTPVTIAEEITNNIV